MNEPKISATEIFVTIFVLAGMALIISGIIQDANAGRIFKSRMESCQCWKLNNQETNK